MILLEKSTNEKETKLNPQLSFRKLLHKFDGFATLFINLLSSALPMKNAATTIEQLPASSWSCVVFRPVAQLLFPLETHYSIHFTLFCTLRLLNCTKVRAFKLETFFDNRRLPRQNTACLLTWRFQWWRIFSEWDWIFCKKRRRISMQCEEST